MDTCAIRGGAYGAGTPREGWDHATGWMRRVLEDVWQPDLKIVEREFTLVGVNPALDQFADLADQMRAEAEQIARDYGRSLAAIPACLHFYNHHRAHSAIGRPPTDQPPDQPAWTSQLAVLTPEVGDAPQVECKGNRRRWPLGSVRDDLELRARTTSNASPTRAIWCGR